MIRKSLRAIVRGMLFSLSGAALGLAVAYICFGNAGIGSVLRWDLLFPRAAAETRTVEAPREPVKIAKTPLVEQRIYRGSDLSSPTIDDEVARLSREIQLLQARMATLQQESTTASNEEATK